jgi:protein TonB
MKFKNKNEFGPFETPSWSLLVKPEDKFNRETRELFAEAVDTAQLMRHKKPEVDLGFQYRKVFELSLAVTLALLITIFQLARQFSFAPSELKTNNFKIEVADIPPTEQMRNPPTPPARPSVPVPTESEFVPEDITIQSTELDFTELPPPPPVEDRYENYRFIPYDEPPVPIGGYAAILTNLNYPAIARKAGIEARVVVAVLIDERGNSVKTQILSSTVSIMGFSDAAQKAVMLVKWKPAKQRDRAVKVWVSFPIRFQLIMEKMKQVS